MKAGGLANFVLVVLFHLLFSGGTVGTNLWLSEWTNDVPVNGTIPIEHAKVWFGGYGGFVAFQGNCLATNTFLSKIFISCEYLTNIHAFLYCK